MNLAFVVLTSYNIDAGIFRSLFCSWKWTHIPKCWWWVMLKAILHIASKNDPESWYIIKIPN